VEGLVADHEWHQAVVRTRLRNRHRSSPRKSRSEHLIREVGCAGTHETLQGGKGSELVTLVTHLEDTFESKGMFKSLRDI